MEIDMCECVTSFHMRREIFMKRCTEKDCNCSLLYITLFYSYIGFHSISLTVVIFS